MREFVGPNLCYRHEGDLATIVHGRNPPTDDEWQNLLDWARTPTDEPPPRGIVYSLGGAPTLKQRAELRGVFTDYTGKVAYVTSSSFARAVSAAIRWFYPSFRTFRPDQFEQALDYLEAIGSERTFWKNSVNEFLRRLDGRPAGFSPLP